MPLPGDQHRDTAASTNPFLDARPQVSEYTAQEIATLQSRLEKQLGPEYISTRPGAGGGKVHYLAAEKVINLANEVFGFNGWSSAIQNVQIDFVDENAQSGKITLGLSTIVRVTLRDGTFHEDIGYGHIENCKGKAAAFEKAKKEAATDALKRALRNFGNVLGNCLYDKDYLQKVTKVKVAPSKWDADNLHRHPDYAPIKRESIAGVEVAQQQQQHEKSSGSGGARRQPSVQSGVSFGSAEFEDDFGESMLNEEDFTHPDEVRLDDSTITSIDTPGQRAVSGPQQGGAQRQGVPRMHSMPQLRPPNVQAPASVTNPQAPQRPQAVQRPPNNAAQAQAAKMLPPQQQSLPQKPQQPNGAQQLQNIPPRAIPPTAHHQPQAQQAQGDNPAHRSNPSSATSTIESPSHGPSHPPQQSNNHTVPNVDGQQMDDHGLPVPRALPADFPTGFVTGRSVDLLNKPPEARPPIANLAFNPLAESPSIRRTHGVNPGKSAPISRQQLGQVSTAGPGAAAAPAGNGANGMTTPVRQNFVNPSADPNRRIGAPMPGPQNRGQYRPPTNVGIKRPALSDVSNIQQPPQMDGASDVKKARTDSGSEPANVDGGPAAVS